MEEMKLFIWEGTPSAFFPGDSLALAHDVEEARRLILDYAEETMDKWDLVADPVVIEEPYVYINWGFE